MPTPCVLAGLGFRSAEHDVPRPEVLGPQPGCNAPVMLSTMKPAVPAYGPMPPTTATTTASQKGITWRRTATIESSESTIHRQPWIHPNTAVSVSNPGISQKNSSSAVKAAECESRLNDSTAAGRGTGHRWSTDGAQSPSSLAPERSACWHPAPRAPRQEAPRVSVRGSVGRARRLTHGMNSASHSPPQAAVAEGAGGNGEVAVNRAGRASGLRLLVAGEVDAVQHLAGVEARLLAPEREVAQRVRKRGRPDELWKTRKTRPPELDRARGTWRLRSNSTWRPRPGSGRGSAPRPRATAENTRRSAIDVRAWPLTLWKAMTANWVLTS